MVKNLRILPVSLLLVLAISCGIPKDGRDGYQNALEDKLHVGVVAHSGDQSGLIDAEVALVRMFAQEKNMEIDLKYGKETSLIQELEKGKLQLVVGGFDKKTIWKEKVALTIPYDHQDHVLLIPKGENRLLFEIEKFIHQ